MSTTTQPHDDGGEAARDRLHARLRERYGDGHALRPREALNPVLDTQLAHRSVRAFLPDALEPGTLELLIAAAQSAPSSSNLQVWSVVAVEDQARKERIAEHAGGQAHIREAPLFLAFLADVSRLASIAKRSSIPSEMSILQDLQAVVKDSRAEAARRQMDSHPRSVSQSSCGLRA